MTTLTVILISAAIGFTALSGIFTVSLSRVAAKPAPPPTPVTAKGRPLAHCAACGRVVAVRKGDGLPYANRHACHNASPIPVGVTGDFVASGGTGPERAA